MRASQIVEVVSIQLEIVCTDVLTIDQAPQMFNENMASEETRDFPMSVTVSVKAGARVDQLTPHVTPLGS